MVPVLLMLLHSFLEFEQAVFLVEMLRHVRVGVMFIEELDSMEAAAVDVEVNVAAVEIRGAGFPYLNLGMHRLDALPDCLTDALALYAHLHIEEGQLAFGLMDREYGAAHTLTVGIDSLVSLGTLSPQ